MSFQPPFLSSWNSFLFFLTDENVEWVIPISWSYRSFNCLFRHSQLQAAVRASRLHTSFIHRLYSIWTDKIPLTACAVILFDLGQRLCDRAAGWWTNILYGVYWVNSCLLTSTGIAPSSEHSPHIPVSVEFYDWLIGLPPWSQITGIYSSWVKYAYQMRTCWCSSH